MRQALVLIAMVVGLGVTDTGCTAPRRSAGPVATAGPVVTAGPADAGDAAPRAQDAATGPTGDAAGDSHAAATGPTAGVSAGAASNRRGTRMVFTAEDNPTTRAGRGAPTLDRRRSPAAWVFIDGKAGRFAEEEEDVPAHSWVIDDKVSRTPTFRVEVYEPLLGDPRDFMCQLQSWQTVDGSRVNYAIRADRGTFEVGREYPLLTPGDNFQFRDPRVRAPTTAPAALVPGVYGLVVGIINTELDVQGLAVTFFTVGADE